MKAFGASNGCFQWSFQYDGGLTQPLRGLSEFQVILHCPDTASWRLTPVSRRSDPTSGRYGPAFKRSSLTHPQWYLDLLSRRPNHASRKPYPASKRPNTLSSGANPLSRRANSANRGLNPASRMLYQASRRPNPASGRPNPATWNHN